MPQLIELHIDTTATQDVYVSPSIVPPNANPGDLVQIRPKLDSRSKGKGKDKPLLFKVEKPIEPEQQDLTAGPSGGGAGVGGVKDAAAAALAQRRRQKPMVTVSPTVALSFGWVKNRIEVELTLVPSPPPRKLCASHVELYFNNMYLSRPDSFQLSLALQGRVLHVGQRVVLPGSGARLRVGDMYSAVASRGSSSRGGGGASTSSSAAGVEDGRNAPLDAAYITSSTKIVFRSESARHYVFVEVSSELWQFEEDGSMLLEKAELFLQELFSHYSGKMSKDAEDTRSKGIPTSHVLSIILYGRVIYDDKKDGEEERAPLQRLENGTMYRDFYKVILDLSPSPPTSIIHTVALELRRWQSTVLLRTRPDGSERLSGRLANAHESPVLEATNLALNSFEEHWIDRDLQRTGLEIVVMTAGSSFYQVEKSLLRLTTERMLFHGIGLDLISLSKMPLHTVPLFQFRSPDPLAASAPAALPEHSTPLLSAQPHLPLPLPPPGTSFPNSPRFAANFGPNRLIHGPSSLQRASPLRDPRALEQHETKVKKPLAAPPAPARVVVPDDQRDPLYYDPPPPPKLTAVPPSQQQQQQHPARTSSHSHSRSLSKHLSPSFSASPSFPSASSPSHPYTHVHAPPPLVPSPPSPAPPPPPTAPETSLYYSEPLFVFPHFFGTQPDKPYRTDRFFPRARCYELFAQGVTERTPISIPLLSANTSVYGGGAAAGGGGGTEGESCLSELERRTQRRERYDSSAVGAREAENGGGEGEGGGGPRVWEVRESGTSGSGVITGESEIEVSGSEGSLVIRTPGVGSESEDSVGSLGGGQSASEGVSEAEGGEGRVGRLKEGNALGLGFPSLGSEDGGSGKGSTSRSSSVVRIRTNRHRSTSRLRTTSSTSAAAVEIAGTAGDDDTNERGRRAARAAERRQLAREASSARDKTPVPPPSSGKGGGRREASRMRDSSVAASVRTISSVQTAATGAGGGGAAAAALRKASTPALIARLTGGAAGGVLSGGGSGGGGANGGGSVGAGSAVGGTSSASPTPSAASAAATKASQVPTGRSSWLNIFNRTASSSLSIGSNPSSSSSTLPAVPSSPSSIPSSLKSPPSSSSALFSASTSTSLAPQVAVARVDVQANLKPNWAPVASSVASTTTAAESDRASVGESEGGAGGGGAGVVLGFSSASQRPSSRSRTRAEAQRAARNGGRGAEGEGGRTMPISIGGKGGGGGSEAGDGQGGKGDGGATRGGGGGGAAGSGGSGRGSAAGGKGMSSSSLKAYDLDGSGVRKAFGLGGGGGKISVAERFNPSKPGKRSVGLADQARRWAGILIAERRNLKLGVKWRSLTRGACLPISTDYLPSAEALQHQYSEFHYTVPTGSVAASPFLRIDHPKRSHILTLVTELICQRLSQGFQICTSGDATNALNAINVATSKTLPDVLRDIQDGEVTAVYLSLSNQVHRIWYDRHSGSVFVKILRRKRTWAKKEEGYHPLIWTQGLSNYDAVSRVPFPYPVMIEPFEWQHNDRLIAGAEADHPSIRYRRTRLLLLPAAKVPDREYIVSITKALQGMETPPSDTTIQAQGFYALMDLLENARWAPAGVEKEPLSITQTTLDAPGWAASVVQAQAAEAVSASPSIVPSQPRPTWLSRMQGRGTTRDDTPHLERDLELPPPVVSPVKDVFAALNRSDTSGSLNTLSSAAPSVPSSHSPRRPVVQMTHAVVLDFDPNKHSERSERVSCHLDRSHNVQAAYHIELAWLTASGKTVDNAIQSWGRQMARYGLNLVEVSTRPVLARHNPFQKPAVFRLAVPPPPMPVGAEGEEEDEEEAVKKVQERPSGTDFYLSRLLRSLGYFLDLGADSTFPSSIEVQYSYRRTQTPHSQFIHRSGSVLVSIFEDAQGPGLAYVPNRIWTSHHPEIDSGETVKTLADLCGSEERLRVFYDEQKDV